MATPSTFRACAAIALFLALVCPAPAAEQIDQSNLPEWAGGWTHVNPTADGQATMWQTFTPAYPNLTAVEIDILTTNPGPGDDVLIVEIARDGVVLASAECSVEDGFDGLLRVEFPEVVPLVPEQVYDLRVRDTGKGQFGWKYGSNTYERGGRFVFAQERPGTDWFFRTYASAEPAATKYSGGTGEPNDPYQIATAADLIALGETPEDYDKHFLLTADIDLDPNLPGGRVFDGAIIAPDTDPEQWGFQGTPFAGVFHGNGRTISRLTIAWGMYVGLFGQMRDGASIRNLGLDGVEVSGHWYVGGLVGHNDGGRITSSYSSGSVNGTECVGGLTGRNGGSIAVSYSNGSVSGYRSVGGLIGQSDGGSVSASCSTGSVSGTYYVAGLVGGNGGTITSSCSTASVRGHKDVGGLVGANSYHGTIDSSFSSGSVSGTGSYYDVGGLVGSNYGGIAASYSTGWVSSGANGDASVGGLVGAGSPSRTIACFWDIQTSGHVTSAGGTGLTTAEMQDLQTFLNARWDFVGEVGNGACDYWQIFPGEYPHLSYGCDNPRLMPEGLGTPEQPYLIRDARDLGSVWFEPLAHYRLAQSVDLSGITWLMAVIPWFGGSFEGNGQVITNLRIEGIADLGVFGVLAPAASVVNLGVKAVEITGTHSVGGLVGFNRGSVTSCYSSGSVSGTGDVGGLVGVSYYSSSITTSYSNSLVSGTEGAIGGLVGYISSGASVIQCYSSGRVSGTYHVGGLVGYEDQYAWPEGSFWDTETSGQTASYGAEGKTTAEMQTAKTFLDAGWDFVGEMANGTEDIWWILEGLDYPRLWWELSIDE